MSPIHHLSPPPSDNPHSLLCGHIGNAGKPCKKRKGHPSTEPHSAYDAQTKRELFWAECGRGSCVHIDANNQVHVSHKGDCPILERKRREREDEEWMRRVGDGIRERARKEAERLIYRPSRKKRPSAEQVAHARQMVIEHVEKFGHTNDVLDAVRVLIDATGPFTDEEIAELAAAYQERQDITSTTPAAEFAILRMRGVTSRNAIVKGFWALLRRMFGEP